jgi:hypothetical protein
MSEPFLLGVNYWPRRKAMYWWADFDAGEVRDEFAMIRGLGLTHVRFFLLWESFQPSPDKVSATALADLRTVCDIAAEIGLLLQPTFFTGHVSGPNRAPDWLLDSKTPRRDDERQLVRRQQLLQPWRADEAGRHGIDANPVGRELGRRGAHQMVQGGLRRAVRHLVANSA